MGDSATGARETIAAPALFVEIGGESVTDWLPRFIAWDEAGHILTGRDLRDCSEMATWPETGRTDHRHTAWRLVRSIP
jgi:hypothetical protein